MTTPYDSVIALSRALDQAGDVLADIHKDQLGRPTPCEDWDVAHLIGHLLDLPHAYLPAARGDEPAATPTPDPAQAGWAAEFRSAADDLIHAWHQAGDAADPEQVDRQTAGFAVHTWDLATATDQDTDRLDPEIAARGLAAATESGAARERLAEYADHG